MNRAERKALFVAELRKRAEARDTITYTEMGWLVDLAPQGPWKAILDDIEADEQAQGRPDLACLVVSASTGLPSYVGSSDAERQSALRERERVFAVHARPYAAPVIVMPKETNVSRNPIRYVPQNHTTQRDKCGVACIAMICRKTFEDVDAKWHGNRNRTGPDEMTSWLTEFGATHDGEWVRPSADFDLKALKHDAVLLTELASGDWVANGHWVVWDAYNQRILDPWSRSSRLGSADVDRYLLISDRP